MLSIIITLVFGLIITFFALQNTEIVTLQFSNFLLPSIPIYIVIIGSFLVGLLLSWIISTINEITAGLTIRGKENKIQDYKKELAVLTRKFHQLELENAELKGETNATAVDKSESI